MRKATIGSLHVLQSLQLLEILDPAVSPFQEIHA